MAPKSPGLWTTWELLSYAAEMKSSCSAQQRGRPEAFSYVPLSSLIPPEITGDHRGSPGITALAHLVGHPMVWAKFSAAFDFDQISESGTEVEARYKEG